MGSLTSVFNLPSEKVPAPPSPNCTLETVSNTPLSQKRSTSFVRSVTERPRSRTTGAQPLIVSAYAQKSPAGPAPTITGGMDGVGETAPGR